MPRFFLALLLTLTITACTQPSLSPTPHVLPSGLPQPSPSSLPPTLSPLPTRQPTATLLPTATQLPTLLPTQTAAPTSLPGPTPTLMPPSDDAEREQRLLVLINALRAEHALPPYQFDIGLSDAARAHSCDMAANSFISHVGSDGRTVPERMPAVEPPWAWPSENIAAGSDDPATIIALWMDEPADGWHRLNLLDPDQQAIGVGYCFRDDDPTGNRSYWTIDLARH